jgi:hypothetical protein
VWGREWVASDANEWGAGAESVHEPTP